MPGPGYYWIGAEEEKEVLDVIRSRRLNRYGTVDDPEFQAKVVTLEKEVCTRFDVPFSLAVTSGTSALIVALNALRIGPGDEVIVPGYTYIASMSAVIFAGAVPVLAEIDESLNLDPADVEARITPRTKAIMVVHMLGNPARLDQLLDIARRHKLLVIEDTAQAFGGQYKGKHLGTFGDVGTYSFNIFKTINAGDGGLLVMKDEELFKTAFAYHDQGHLPLRMGLEVGKRSVIGMNFRMNELTGAVLIAQLRKLDALLGDLRRIKTRLKNALSQVPGVGFRDIVDEKGECSSLLVMLLPDAAIAKNVAAELGSKTISESGWHVYNNMEQILAKRQLTVGPPFQSKEFPTTVEYTQGMLPKTDAILTRAINLSIGVVDAGLGSGYGLHPKATNEEIDQVAETVTRALKKYL
ncbi:MAG: DegT/DnrJ/EryC1/StrS family aminotransferase [Spirochaetaceae bacterium]|nr:MAG: DegT/DnrJ/EryC1/StrS family aminotransferase [Spirochaetaceae bacterium]